MKSVRIFRNQNVLNAMLELRRRGWTYQSLGLLFNVDHSSIYMACKLRKIAVPHHPISLNIFDVISQFIKPVDPPKVSKEIMYRDFLEKEREISLKQRFPKLYLIKKSVS